MADRVTGIQVDFGLNSQGAPSSLFQAAQQSELPRSPPPCMRPLMVIQSADATSHQHARRLHGGRNTQFILHLHKIYSAVHIRRSDMIIIVILI